MTPTRIINRAPSRSHHRAPSTNGTASANGIFYAHNAASANGATHNSPGRRPGCRTPNKFERCKRDT